MRIVSAREMGGVVRGDLETNIPLPVEVMVGVVLQGLGDHDRYVGHSVRLTITQSPQSFSIPTRSPDGPLPAGAYDVEVDFYPRWGAQNGPPVAKAITREISARRAITLGGSGESAAEMRWRLEAQEWVMRNVFPGNPWDASALERRLGPSERLAVTNRTAVAVGFYYPRADMTIFVSTALNEVLAWRKGRRTAI
ncbi:MAG: hypothetical protein JNJ73_04605 [Hyphomonadaceae bacterium]|nr:hypothetical protein [Hyphomonadaceae bacterium]